MSEPLSDTCRAAEHRCPPFPCCCFLAPLHAFLFYPRFQPLGRAAAGRAACGWDHQSPPEPCSRALPGRDFLLLAALASCCCCKPGEEVEVPPPRALLAPQRGRDVSPAVPDAAPHPARPRRDGTRGSVPAPSRSPEPGRPELAIKKRSQPREEEQRGRADFSLTLFHSPPAPSSPGVSRRLSRRLRKLRRPMAAQPFPLPEPRSNQPL